MFPGIIFSSIILRMIGPYTQSIDSKSLKMSRKEMLRAELDDIIAAECIYCGSIMIDLIDKPFISDEDWDEVNAQWQ